MPKYAPEGQSTINCATGSFDSTISSVWTRSCTVFKSVEQIFFYKTISVFCKILFLLILSSNMFCLESAHGHYSSCIIEQYNLILMRWRAIPVQKRADVDVLSVEWQFNALLGIICMLVLSLLRHDKSFGLFLFFYQNNYRNKCWITHEYITHFIRHKNARLNQFA